MCPPEVGSQDAENEAVLQAAKLMLVSARTAPKSAGIDDIFTVILYGKEKDAIAGEMDKIAEERKLSGFTRDAKNTRDSQAIVLIGVRGNKSFGLDCGACGFGTCEEFNRTQGKPSKDFEGPTCLFKSLDLGIAMGSAAKTADVLNVDNRIMYRVGAAAKRLKMLPDANIIMGIPISAKGKSIYYDRSK